MSKAMERVISVFATCFILCSCSNHREESRLHDLILIQLGLKSFLEDYEQNSNEKPSLEDLENYIDKPLITQLRNNSEIVYVFDRPEIQGIMPEIVALDFRGSGVAGIFRNGNVIGCEELLRLVTLHRPPSVTD